jgi:ferredoxin
MAAKTAADTVAVSMTVNGKPVTANVDPRTLLVQLLRETLRLTGTHVGCDTSQCGACVVLVNGKAIKSCTALALQLEGADVLTIEGLAATTTPSANSSKAISAAARATITSSRRLPPARAPCAAAPRRARPPNREKPGRKLPMGDFRSKE